MVLARLKLPPPPASAPTDPSRVQTTNLNSHVLRGRKEAFSSNCRFQPVHLSITSDSNTPDKQAQRAIVLAARLLHNGWGSTPAFWEGERKNQLMHVSHLFARCGEQTLPTRAQELAARAQPSPGSSPAAACRCRSLGTASPALHASAELASGSLLLTLLRSTTEPC